MKNIAISLSYNGSAYHGWQVQKEDVTVAGTLEDALSSVLGETVKVVGCGRTDGGVHARNYCASFRMSSAIPVDRLPQAVNGRLPGDISVSGAIEVPGDFNAISSCIKKEYVYKILNSKIRDPFLDKRVCFYPGALDFYRFSAAASMFEGTHDFASVRSAGAVTRTSVRTVYWCRASIKDGMISLHICADGFLYNMARTITGTCLYAAVGKIEPEGIPALLDSRDRTLAGPTMPPYGLYLNRLWYDKPAGQLFDR